LGHRIVKIIGAGPAIKKSTSKPGLEGPLKGVRRALQGPFKGYSPCNPLETPSGGLLEAYPIVNPMMLLLA